jgi:hypothetical protein
MLFSFRLSVPFKYLKLKTLLASRVSNAACLALETLTRKISLTPKNFRQTSKPPLPSVDNCSDFFPSAKFSRQVVHAATAHPCATSLFAQNMTAEPLEHD